jgi:hypothetical protein
MQRRLAEGKSQKAVFRNFDQHGMDEINSGHAGGDGADYPEALLELYDN